MVPRIARSAFYNEILALGLGVRNSGTVWDMANPTAPRCVPKAALHDGTVPVNKKFTFDDRRTIVLQCERFCGTAFSHHFSSVPSSVPFRFHSVLLANQRDPCKVSVNASFGSEDDLQLLQMVAEGSRYESASLA